MNAQVIAICVTIAIAAVGGFVSLFFGLRNLIDTKIENLRKDVDEKIVEISKNLTGQVDKNFGALQSSYQRLIDSLADFRVYAEKTYLPEERWREQDTQNRNTYAQLHRRLDEFEKLKVDRTEIERVFSLIGTLQKEKAEVAEVERLRDKSHELSTGIQRLAHVQALCPNCSKTARVTQTAAFLEAE